MISDRPGSHRERRREKRRPGDDFPLLAPPEAKIVDCGRRGVGIETSAHLAVGSLTSVDVFLPAGAATFVGRVCWARLVGHRPLTADETRPVFRVGLCLDEDPAIERWGLLRARLIAPRGARRRVRPGRRIVRWRRPAGRRAR